MNPAIIVVDDDADDLEMIDSAFRQLGCNSVKLMERATEALQYLGECESKNGLPHVLVTDLNLPQGSGFDLLREVRNRPGLSEVHVVVLSTSNNKKDIEKCSSMGACAFITKPNFYKGYQDFARKVMSYFPDAV
jgi:CheY-like chemotaxis protein